jgi:hypothetical protein
MRLMTALRSSSAGRDFNVAARVIRSVRLTTERAISCRRSDQPSSPSASPFASAGISGSAKVMAS